MAIDCARPAGTIRPLHGVNGVELRAGVKVAGIEKVGAVGGEQRPGLAVRLVDEDVLEADEVFSSGNYGKVLPITGVEDRAKPMGAIYQMARRLYWDYAHKKN